MDAVPEIAVTDRLEQLARGPERVAIHWVEDGTETSYQQLAELSRRWSAVFLRHGVAVEDRVVIMSSSGLDFVGAYLGALACGAVASPVSTELRGASLEHPLALYQPRAIVVDADVAGLVDAVTSDWDRPPISLVLDDTFRDEMDTLPTLDPSDLPRLEMTDAAMIMATSGTTGPSKGSIWTHGLIRHWCSNFAKHLGYTSDDRIYSCTPLNHSNALICGVCTAIYTGGSVAMARRFSVSQFWSQIRSSGSTSANLIGAMIHLLVEAEVGEIPPPATLRTLLVSSCSAEDYLRISADWGILPVAGYGLTDFGMITLGSAFASNPPGSCGRVAKGFELRLVDEHQMEVAPGEVGEAIVRPTLPGITPIGYFGMPEETLRSRRDLWFHTGDLLWRDDDGWYYFAGRLKEALRYRGENVSAFEVESALMQSESVKEAAVYPVPSELGEDEIAAAVVLCGGAPQDPAAIIRDISQNLPYYAVPRYVRVLDELPKNHSLRVTKAVLIRQGTPLGTWDRLEEGFVVARNQARV